MIIGYLDLWGYHLSKPDRRKKGTIVIKGLVAGKSG